MKESMILLIASTDVMKKMGSEYPTEKRNGEPYSPQISTYNYALMEYEFLEDILFH